ncbi:LPXTG cell wall anchor domain-containing protein [Enterococcus sp. LJL90]
MIKKIVIVSCLAFLMSFCFQLPVFAAENPNNSVESQLTIELVSGDGTNLPTTGKLPQTNEIAGFSLAFLGTISLVIGLYLFKKNKRRGGDG